MTFTNLSRAEAPASERKLTGNSTLTWLTAALTIFTFIQTAQSGDLTDIRTGFHRTYSRIVVQFDTDVKFQVIKDVENGTVIIDILGVNAVRNFGEINLDQKDQYLRRVSFKKSPTLLSITAILKRKNLRVDHYYLNRPFRIVLDVYPSSVVNEPAEKNDSALQPEQKPNGRMSVAMTPEIDSLQSTESDSVEPSAVDSFALSATAVDSLEGAFSANYDSTKTLLGESIIPLQASLNSVKSELQRIAGKQSSKQNRLMSKSTLSSATVAAFILIDLIWVAVYLTRRSRKRKPTLQTRKKLAKKQFVPERTNREFVEVLKSTLESNEIEEVRKEDEVVRANEPVPANRRDRLESMLRAFSESVNIPQGAPLTPPELSEVARDLGAIAPASPASKKVTRKELMGKDGAEFLKNLQKQSFN